MSCQLRLPRAARGKRGPIKPAATGNLRYVCLAFRCVQKDDHYLNELAASLTGKVGQVHRTSHVEIILEDPDDDTAPAYSFSILKGTLEIAKDGKKKMIPGKVHKRQIVQPLPFYVYVFHWVTTQQHRKVWTFLSSQVEAPFNTLGYYFNFFLPEGMTYGPRHLWDVDPEERTAGAGGGPDGGDGSDVEFGGAGAVDFTSGHAWFCSSLVAMALVVLDVLPRTTNVSKCSPNDLLRRMMSISPNGVRYTWPTRPWMSV
jgi:hypothetical protein